MTRASGQKLVARSREANGRLPTTWQTELTDQVTWCSSATRIRPAQKKAVTAPAHEPVTSPAWAARAPVTSPREAVCGPHLARPRPPAEDQATIARCFPAGQLTVPPANPPSRTRPAGTDPGGGPGRARSGGGCPGPATAAAARPGRTSRRPASPAATAAPPGRHGGTGRTA